MITTPIKTEMLSNFYWSVYKSLEKELVNLSYLIHIDDKQLTVYSIKIAELLLRTSVEIESISKTLYFRYGGEKKDNKELFFDTDCLDLLQLSKKQVQISGSNFYFAKSENQVFTPLKKANQRGTSSSDWQQAYQAVKHHRVQSLSKANLKHLIRALAALYLLNIYLNDNKYQLGTDSSGLNFDRSLGSSLFSIKLHVNTSPISIDQDCYCKNSDFDECVFLLKTTDDTRNIVQEQMKKQRDLLIKRMENPPLINQIMEHEITLKNPYEPHDVIKNIINNIIINHSIEIAKENKKLFFKSLNGLKYEAILNKQQY